MSVPQLKDVFEDLRAFRKYLAEQIEDAETTVMRLGSDWSGQARDAQVEFFSQLAQGMADIDEGLAEFSKSVNSAHGHYSKAISANKSMWPGK
ncbi:WXG100 family type VII secretion target [Mycobacteroides abscessus]|uniref:WXG100 family type VII secretion target n=1 Tax=Mycobacteroides abscessus TaxID=36809 RepID=UPI001F18E990|nr:WXG100 family type VII secretion target [Mycobacteroides abscessus]